MKNIYNIKGVKEVLFPEIYKWQYIENSFRKIVESYGYDRIKLRLLERTDLFKSTLGKESDVIKKEMFSFNDKSGKSITLLPEGTTSCIKSLFNAGLLRNNSRQNVWYISPMFRREKPQKGRQRLFYQIGVESYGFKDYWKDIEHIIIFKNFLEKINVNIVLLELNCINRELNNFLYNDILRCFFLERTLNFKSYNDTNIDFFYLLDRDQDIYKIEIPKPINFLGFENKNNFLNMLYFLKLLNLVFIINDYLLRGLEYYSSIIYEWTVVLHDKRLTICAGGRYDFLSSKIFGIKVCSTGYAFGMERLILILNDNIVKRIDFLVNANNKISSYVNFRIMGRLRTTFERRVFIYECSKTIFKKLKKNYRFARSLNFVKDL